MNFTSFSQRFKRICFPLVSPRPVLPLFSWFPCFGVWECWFYYHFKLLLLWIGTMVECTRSITFTFHFTFCALALPANECHPIRCLLNCNYTRQSQIELCWFKRMIGNLSPGNVPRYFGWLSNNLRALIRPQFKQIHLTSRHCLFLHANQIANIFLSLDGIELILSEKRYSVRMNCHYLNHLDYMKRMSKKYFKTTGILFHKLSISFDMIFFNLIWFSKFHCQTRWMRSLTVVTEA